MVCSLSNYTDFEKIKDKYKASISAKALAVRVLSLAKTNKQKQDRIGVVDGLLYEYERSSKSVISMDKEKKLLVRINKLLARHSSLLDEYENIDNGIYETNLVAEKILSYQETIDENKKLLPEICPLCGGKL